MNIGDIFEVKIEKLTNLGVGLSHINGIVVFVENVCPDDVVKIRIDKITKNYVKASLLEIMKPSDKRIEAFCPMQKICGACQLQFINYDFQLEIKQTIVQETINKIGGIYDITIPKPVSSPKIKCFRHKIQYPITETKNSKRILAGYYKTGSHDIVNIKYCPIQPEICDNIIEYIRENSSKFGMSGYVEKNNKGDLKHVVIRNSVYSGENLVTLVINNNKSNSNIEQFCKSIYKNFEKVSGVCINFNPIKTNVILGKKTKCICGNPYIEEKILDKMFKIGTETFFQINPESASNIFSYVKDYIKQKYKNNANVLDAYAGISAFGICISDVCKSVVTVEENKESVKLAKESLNINKISNVEINECDASEFLKQETRLFDVVILDPPRKGCSNLSLDEAYRLTKDSIIYVSCNPATLARDLKYLKEKGAIVKSVKPFDMFCHTYHIENVAIIMKNSKE